MPSKIKMRLDTFSAHLLVAMSDIGGICFAYNDIARESSGKEPNEFCDVIGRLSDDIEERYREGEVFEVTEHEYLTLLISIRGAFESLMTMDGLAFKRMLDVYDHTLCKKNKKIKNSQLKKLCRDMHILLDYLECHAPDSVMVIWLDERRESSKTMLTAIQENHER